MACYYIYKSGEGSLSTLKESLKEISESEIQDYIDSEEYIIGRTVSEVERILANKGIFDDQSLYKEDPSLVFYDASISPREETLIKIQKAIEETKKHLPSYEHGKGNGVKAVVEDAFNEFKKDAIVSEHSYEDGDSEEEKWLLKFQGNLGELFHKCVETFGNESEFKNSCDELIEFLKETKVPMNYEKNLYIQNRAKILLTVPINEDEQANYFEEVISSLKKTCSTIHRAAGFNKDTLFEVPIMHFTVGPDGKAERKILGIMDAIQVLDDGSVVIYDFKSSARQGKGVRTAISHYGQLFMYQHMLEAYGIPANKIVIKNINVRYDAAKFELNLDKGSPFFTFASSTVQNIGTLEAKVRSKLRKFFPLLQGGILENEARQIKEDIETLQKSIFSEKSLNRNEPENLREYLTKEIDPNKPFKSEHLDETVLVEVKDNVLILRSLDGARKTTHNIDDFVKSEIAVRVAKREEEFWGFKQAIKSKNAEQLKHLMSEYKNRDLTILNSLRHYLEPEWEVVDFGDAENENRSSASLFDSLGILVLYNTNTNTYDFVNLTPNTRLETPYTLHLDQKRTMNLLGNLFSEQDLAKYKSADMMANISNIRVLQTLIAISLGQKVLKTKDGVFKVGTIKTVSTISGLESFNMNYSSFVRQIAIINAIGNEYPEKVQHKELFQRAYDGVKKIHWAPFEDTLSQKLYSLIFNNEGLKYKTEWINSFKSAVESDNLSDKIQKLIEVQKQFRRDFYQEFDNENKIDRTYITDIQKIDQMLSTLIQTYQGLMTDQAYKTSGMGLDYDNSVRTAWQLLKNGDVGKFSANGVLLTGLLQGLSSATPYANPDDSVRMLSTLHSFGTTQIQMEAEPYIDDQNRATSEWLASKESLMKTLLIGNHRELYKQLFETKDGKIDPAFRFKNPFKDISLSDADKKYLKTTIWNLLRIREDFTLFSTEVKRLTWLEFSKNSANVKQLETYLASNKESLNIPLRTGSEGRLLLEMCKSLTKGNWKSAGDFWKRKLDKSKNWWDPSGLTERQLNEKEEKIKTLEAYNMYSESLTDRSERLSQNPIEAFEWNINFLVNDFVYSNISVNVNQKILDTTDRMVASLKYIQMLTGRDLSDQIEEIKKRTRISMFNSNNVEESYKDAVDFVSHLRTLLNLGKIAFRPVLMGKELTVSRIKNYMYTAFDYFQNDNISLKSMLRADGIVFGEGVFTDKWNKFTGKMKPGDKSKVESLNWLYRIANMDANVVSQRTIADRWGFMNAGGDIAYYTNTRPDWYSRMSIFVAKMIEDGSWDAHELDPTANRLKYNMAKDKRYAIFAKYIGKNPPTPSDSDYEEFQKQQARYNWALDSMTKAGITKPDGLTLKYGDMLPIAYTVEETNSIKELTGMLYGYYNHEEKTSFQTGTYSHLFMAFKTYLAGELKHYFALPNAKTSMGKVTHITDGIPTKEHPNGSPLYIQYDEVTDIEIYTTEQYDKSGKPNKPHYGWVASPQEGLVTSLLICIGDVFTEKGRQDLRTNKRRRQNAELFLFRAILFGLFASLFALLLKGADDETAAGLSIAYDVAKKASNDLSFYHSVIAPIDDMGIVGVDYVTSLARGAMNTLTNGDKGLQSYIFKNVQAAKDFVSLVESD